jgi:hypothetical protein
MSATRKAERHAENAAAEPVDCGEKRTILLFYKTLFGLRLGIILWKQNKNEYLNIAPHRC